MPESIISIILPAYNCSQHLAQAIESILAQTFTNFELLIIDDGSTDNTAKIIKSFTDTRIVNLSNEVNKGLIYSLNRGITFAKGAYIARMDADDICLPTRLQVQYNWLQNHPGTAVVGSLIAFIDNENNFTGFWPLDKKTIDKDAIYRTMPKVNCIAHPSVMLRTDIAKKYKYAYYQQHIEDYDLWLRILRDGNIIEKVPEVLLNYRQHPQSITKTKLQKNNPFFKQFHCKRKFLYYSLAEHKAGWFAFKVLFYMKLNLAVGIAKEIRKKFKK